MNWAEFFQHEPSTSLQRRTLYRLGRSHAWVHSHIKTKQDASTEIARLLNEEGEYRAREKNYHAEECELATNSLNEILV